jgi:hypothetical protein
VLRRVASYRNSLSKSCRAHRTGFSGRERRDKENLTEILKEEEEINLKQRISRKCNKNTKNIQQLVQEIIKLLINFRIYKNNYQNIKLIRKKIQKYPNCSKIQNFSKICPCMC